MTLDKRLMANENELMLKEFRMNVFLVVLGSVGFGDFKYAFTKKMSGQIRAGFLGVFALAWFASIAFEYSQDIYLLLQFGAVCAFLSMLIVVVRAWNRGIQNSKITLYERLVQHMVYLYREATLSPFAVEAQLSSIIYCLYWYLSNAREDGNDAIVKKMLRIFESAYLDFDGKGLATPDMLPEHLIELKSTIEEVIYGDDINSHLRKMLHASFVRMHAEEYSVGAANQLAVFLQLYEFAKANPKLTKQVGLDFDSMQDMILAINGSSLHKKFDIALERTRVFSFDWKARYLIFPSNWKQHRPKMLLIPRK